MEPRKETNREPKAPVSSGASKAPKKQPGTGAQPGAGAQAVAGAQAGTQGAQAGGQQPQQNLAQHAKQATGEIVNQVQQQATSQINERKKTAAEDLSKVVTAVRQFGQNLTGEQSGPIGRYAAEYGDKAAENLERFANYIREQEPKQLLNDVQNFGRRRPGLMLGGAFLLGLAGARLLKSSMAAASDQSFTPDMSTARQPNRSLTGQPSGNAR
jgi:hypothetical protein